MTKTGSILLYGIEGWAVALRLEFRMKILSSIQRSAHLRVGSAYRTVSKSAILVISDAISLGLQASERKGEWETKKVLGETVIVDDTKKRNIQYWQEKWNTEMSGRWRAKLPAG